MRTLQLNLFLKLCLFCHLCNCNEVPESEISVYLINPQPECEDDGINNIFRYAAKTTTNIVNNFHVHLPPKDTDNYSLPTKMVLDQFLDFNKSLTNTIAIGVLLCVKDFYQHNYNDILQRGFKFAGHTGVEHKTDVCRSKQTNKIKHGTREMETCEKSTETSRNVKLVSKNVEHVPKLQKLIANYDENFLLSDQNMVIIICGDPSFPRSPKDYISSASRFIVPARIEYMESCAELPRKNTIAVLTPKPFEPEQKFYTTTVFYDYQFNSSPKDVLKLFRNSVYMLDSEDENVKGKYKLAFLKSVQMMGANRVIIVSDNNPESVHFERELTSLFEQNNIVYASKACVVTRFSSCDFRNIFEPIATLDANLLIVNVGEEYADTFLYEVTQLKKQNSRMEILFRAWSTDKAIYATRFQGLDNLYSVTLTSSPEPPANDINNFIDLTWWPELLQYNHLYGWGVNILEPLNTIKIMLQYNLINPDLLENIDHHRNISTYINAMRIQNSKHHVTASILKFSSWSPTPTSVADIFIEGGTPREMRRDVLPTVTTHNDCIIKSSNFYNKCNDLEVMLIMLVIAVFSLTLLGIVYFFQSTDISYSRMAC